MEDDSLDDFFAKKDKSKKKGKAKITPNDILAKQDEKPKKKSKRKKEEKPTTAGAEQSEGVVDEKESGNAPAKVEDEEWADYEQEEKDYSGLRIQTLQIREEGSEDDKETRESGDEGGEEGDKGDGVKGPWNKSTAPASKKEPPPPPEPKPEPVKEEAPSKAPGKYVPPSVRAAQAASSGGLGPLRRGRKNAPNIQSEEDFPTLGVAAPVEVPDTNPISFERVRGGGRYVEDDRNKGLKLQLDNKFASLGE